MSDAPAERPLVHLQQPGDLPALQAFILALEARQGWDREDMRTCLLHMGEELGEVYEAARRRLSESASPHKPLPNPHEPQTLSA